MDGVDGWKGEGMERGEREDWRGGKVGEWGGEVRVDEGLAVREVGGIGKSSRLGVKRGDDIA